MNGSHGWGSHNIFVILKCLSQDTVIIMIIETKECDTFPVNQVLRFVHHKGINTSEDI